jgi:hypothetical protein
MKLQELRQMLIDSGMREEIYGRSYKATSKNGKLLIRKELGSSRHVNSEVSSLEYHLKALGVTGTVSYDTVNRGGYGVWVVTAILD